MYPTVIRLLWFIETITLIKISTSDVYQETTTIQISSIDICDPSLGDPEIFIRTYVDGNSSSYWDTSIIEADYNYETLTWTDEIETYNRQITSVTFQVYDEDFLDDELRGQKTLVLADDLFADNSPVWGNSYAFTEAIYHSDDECYEYLDFILSFDIITPTSYPTSIPSNMPTMSPTIDWSIFVDLGNFTCVNYDNYDTYTGDTSYEECMTECYELQLNDQCSMVIYNYTYNVNYTSFGDCYIFENTDQICDIEDISNNDAQYTQVETYLISNQFECDSYPNDWKDDDNNDCTEYSGHGSMGWCSNGTITVNVNNFDLLRDSSIYNLSAVETCCDCGGGVTTFDVLIEFDNSNKNKYKTAKFDAKMIDYDKMYWLLQQDYIDLFDYHDKIDMEMICYQTIDDWLYMADTTNTDEFINFNFKQWHNFDLYQLCNVVNDQIINYQINHNNTKNVQTIKNNVNCDYALPLTTQYFSNVSMATMIDYVFCDTSELLSLDTFTFNINTSTSHGNIPYFLYIYDIDAQKFYLNSQWFSSTVFENNNGFIHIVDYQTCINQILNNSNFTSTGYFITNFFCDLESMLDWTTTTTNYSTTTTIYSTTFFADPPNIDHNNINFDPLETLAIIIGLLVGGCCVLCIGYRCLGILTGDYRYGGKNEVQMARIHSGSSVHARNRNHTNNNNHHSDCYEIWYCLCCCWIVEECANCCVEALKQACHEIFSFFVLVIKVCCVVFVMIIIVVIVYGSYAGWF